MKNKSFNISKIAALIILSSPVSLSYAACIANGTTLNCNDVTIWNNGDYNISTYDKVVINNTPDAAITGGVRGWGIYSAGQLINLKDVDITTRGEKSDGIVTKNGTNRITIDKLKIKTTGSSADGINLGKESNGYTITIGDNANIDAYSMGVRSNSSASGAGENLIILGKNATITSHESGRNFELLGREAGTGYSIYAGNTNSSATGSARVVLGDGSIITSLGNNAHAVYANKGGIIELGSTTITATGTGSHGIYAEAGSKMVSGANATVGSQVYLAGDTAITIDRASTQLAIYAKGVDSRVASTARLSGADTTGIFTVDGNIKAEAKGLVDLRMADGSHFTGLVNSLEYHASGLANTTTNGTVNLNIAGTHSVWNMTANSVISNLTLDGATLKYVEPTDLTDPSAFATKSLIVAGNYTSNGGTLVLNTVLKDDTSATDKLIVKGDTAGHTNVMITNIGGSGALTVNGIEIVEVEGSSAGTFGNSQRIVAGAFDYFVRSGSTISGANANHWYLISDYSPTVPPPVEPPPVEPPPIDPPPIDPGPDPKEKPKPLKPVEPVYRPEAGSYLANLAAANTLFITRLHDRLGETQYTDALTGETRVTSMWMRHIGGHNRFHDGRGQLKTTGNRYVMQLGGDLAQWSTDGLDRWHLGAMAGYANNSSRTHSSVTPYSSKGDVDGYSVGLYGTWYANQADKNGAYIDSWMLYNWFDNEVKGEQLKTEKYQSKGVTASIEGGYSVKLGESARTRYWIQPKAQAVWMGITADDHRESNGTRVKHDTDNNLMTRLGVRGYANGHHQMDDGKDREFQPFVELNWLHNTQSYTVIMNSQKNAQAGAKNLGEVKLGIEGKLSHHLTTWANVSHQFGSESYSDTQGMFGVKYSF